MVKIRDLSNKQIVEQLTKYFKFISALDNERQKRIKSGQPQEELYTREEIEAREIAEVSRVSHEQGAGKVAESTTIFHLKMDDNHLDELADNASQSGADEQLEVSDLLAKSRKKSFKTEEAPLNEFESDVTSHKLDLAPKVTKKRIFKKK
jgi:hypothetical protein